MGHSDLCSHWVHQHNQQPQPDADRRPPKPRFINDVQPRHGGRFEPHRAAFEKLRRRPRTVGGEPFPIFLMHVGGVTEPGFERLEIAVGQPIELGVRRVIVDIHGRPMVLRQQLVIGVDRSGVRPHGQPGGPPQIGPVPPAVVDVIGSNPGLLPEGEDGHIRPPPLRQCPQFLQQRFPRRPPHRPPSPHPRRTIERAITSLPPNYRRGCARFWNSRVGECLGMHGRRLRLFAMVCKGVPPVAPTGAASAARSFSNRVPMIRLVTQP